MAKQPELRTTSISDNDQWTPVVRMGFGQHYAITIGGVFQGTLQLQRRLNSEDPWRKVTEYTEMAEEDRQSGGAFYYRLGSTDWIAGAAAVAIVTRY